MYWRFKWMKKPFQRNKISSVCVGRNLTSNPLDGSRVQRMGFFSKVKRQQIIIGFTLALNKLQEKEAKWLYKLLPALIHSHSAGLSRIIYVKHIEMTDVNVFTLKFSKDHIYLSNAFNAISATQQCTWQWFQQRHISDSPMFNLSQSPQLYLITNNCYLSSRAGGVEIGR